MAVGGEHDVVDHGGIVEGAQRDLDIELRQERNDVEGEQLVHELAPRPVTHGDALHIPGDSSNRV